MDLVLWHCEGETECVFASNLAEYVPNREREMAGPEPWGVLYGRVAEALLSQLGERKQWNSKGWKQSKSTESVGLKSFSA